MLDPRFPEPLVGELDITLFCNSDHGHDKVTGQSVTRIFKVVASTPVLWTSKRQLCVQTSILCAEFIALKKGVKKAVALRYHLREMRVEVSKPTPIFMDNMSVVLNASNPDNTLNKKTIALSYHFVWEHVE
eukprot:4763633-Ditylum_brightwellii.AAC.1